MWLLVIWSQWVELTNLAAIVTLVFAVVLHWAIFCHVTGIGIEGVPEERRCTFAMAFLMVVFFPCGWAWLHSFYVTPCTLIHMLCPFMCCAHSCVVLRWVMAGSHSIHMCLMRQRRWSSSSAQSVLRWGLCNCCHRRCCHCCCCLCCCLCSFFSLCRDTGNFASSCACDQEIQYKGNQDPRKSNQVAIGIGILHEQRSQEQSRVMFQLQQ